MSAAVQAVPVFDGNGLLTGFTDLSVGPGTYNVTFVDGTYNSVFPSGPLFDTALIGAAASALYSSFAPQNSAGLSIAPYNIFGCNDSTLQMSCMLLTPFDDPFNPAGDVSVMEMRHGDQSIGGNVQDGIISYTLNTTTNTTGFTTNSGAASYVWAVWTRAGTVTPVPEPSTLGLLGLGLAGLGLSRRRKAH